MKTYPLHHVPHQQTEIWEALGWQFVDFLPPPLGAVCQLYGWPFNSEPKFPPELTANPQGLLITEITNSGESERN